MPGWLRSEQVAGFNRNRRLNSSESAAIPYRDTSHPPVSVWELRAARQRLKEEGRQHVDEAALFEAVDRLRRRTEEAVVKTKAARRHQHQIDRLAKRRPGGQAAPAATASAGSQPTGPASEDDIFAEPVLPFEAIAGHGGGA